MWLSEKNPTQSFESANTGISIHVKPFLKQAEILTTHRLAFAKKCVPV